MHFLFLALMLFASSATWAADAPETTMDRILRTNTIRCGYLVWPPFIRVDANTGQVSGINHDYMEALAKELGVKLEWAAEVGVGDYIEALNANRFDVMCASVWPDPGRMRQTLLTQPIFYSAIFPVIRADDDRFNSGAASLNKPEVTIAGIEGDVTADIVRRIYSNAKLAALPQMADGAQLMLQVSTGKADAAFADKSIVADFIKTNGPKIRILSEEQPARVFPELLSVRKGDADVQSFLNTGIEVLNANGVAAEILSHYDTSSFAPANPFISREAK